MLTSYLFLRISNMRERRHDCLLDQDRVHLGSITVVHEVTDEPFSHFPIDCFHFVWICCVHRCINLITEGREILSSIDPMKILLTLGLMKKEVFLCTFAKDWEFCFFIFITSWMDEKIGFTISEPLFIDILQCLCRDLLQQILFSSRLTLKITRNHTVVLSHHNDLPTLPATLSRPSPCPRHEVGDFPLPPALVGCCTQVPR